MEKKFYNGKLIKRHKRKKKLGVLKINIFSLFSLIIRAIIMFFNLVILTKRKSKTNYIHLALNIDNKYIYPCLVYLTSLLLNRAYSTFYIFHILTGKNIRNDIFQKVNETIIRFGKYHSNVSFYNMGEQFKRATSGTIITTAAYYRISLSSILPNVDKIIYSDSDMINFKDLSKLYNMQFKDGIYFIGPLDHLYHRKELEKKKIYIDKYINSGLLLMNLKAIREDKIENKLKDFISNNFLNHHEQTAINAVCNNNTQILSYKYVIFWYDSFDLVIKINNEQNEKYKYSMKELEQGFKSPFLLHFCGYVKPWDKKSLNKRRVYWWYFAKKSLFYKEILDTYEFKKEEIEELLKNIPKNGSLLN